MSRNGRPFRLSIFSLSCSLALLLSLPELGMKRHERQGLQRDQRGAIAFEYIAIFGVLGLAIYAALARFSPEVIEGLLKVGYDILGV
jgi:Flp pilus assembly pilin Flp